MIEVFYPPQWFYKWEAIIDFISVFVLSLIAIFSISYYAINKKNRNYFYLGLSFLLIALSFIFKMLSNLIIYSRVLKTGKVGFITISYEVINSTNFHFAGLLVYRTLTVLGLYTLYLIHKRKQPRTNILITLTLLLILVYFSQYNYHLFHIISLIFLSCITFEYYEIYGKNKSFLTKLVVCSYGLIAMSEFLFIFVRIDTLIYIIAELIQLIGYLILLFTFIKVRKNAKKKKQT